MYRYTVKCQFNDTDPQDIGKWLEWLRDSHIADVMKGGSTGATVVKLDEDTPTYEIRYQFRSREDFIRYEKEFAPGLKAEGAQLFPVDELGMTYSRCHGEVVFSKFE